MQIIAIALLSLLCGVVSCQSLRCPDSDKNNTFDRGVGGVRMKLPSPEHVPKGQPGLPTPPPPVTTPTQPSPSSDTPPTTAEAEPALNPPTFYGEEVGGQMIFLLDATGSMTGSKIASLRLEITQAIMSLRECDEFDLIAYGTQFPAPSYTNKMAGSLIAATAANKEAAIAWVNSAALNPGENNPDYYSLKECCATYPPTLKKFFYVSDGGAWWSLPPPGGGSPASAIIAQMPTWMERFEHCSLVAICIRGWLEDKRFMTLLAAVCGGTVIFRD